MFEETKNFLIKNYGEDVETEKIYFEVPFKYKNLAKFNGGKWDKINKKWYVLNNENKVEFSNLQ